MSRNVPQPRAPRPAARDCARPTPAIGACARSTATTPTRPAVTLSGHGKPVCLLQWHPTAGNVLASAGKDPNIKVRGAAFFLLCV